MAHAPSRTPQSPHNGSDLHSGRLDPDKLCLGRKGQDKRHRCFKIPNSPGCPYFQSGLPRRQGMPPAPTWNPTPRYSPDQPGRRRAPGLSGDEAPLAGSQPCRGGRGCLRKLLLGADSSLQVGKDAVGEDDPGTSPSCPKSEVEGLSAQRVSHPPGTRAARRFRRCILAGACVHRVRRAALRLSSGSRSGLQLGLRRSPRHRLRPRWEPGGRGPSRQPQLQPVFVASSRSTSRRRLAAPGFARRWGVDSFEVARTCSGPGASPGMHRPPQVAKSYDEKAPAPPPLALSPGSGGRGSRSAAAAKAVAASGGGSDAAPETSALRNNRSGWGRKDVGTARRTLHRACELVRCSRGGARWALTHP